MNEANETPSERRAGLRRIVRTRVRLALDSGLNLEARSLNLSTSGMAIVVDRTIAADATLNLRCVLTQAGSPQEFLAQARVLHCVYSGAETGFVVGLGFMWLAPEMSSLISAVIQGA